MSQPFTSHNLSEKLGQLAMGSTMGFLLLGEEEAPPESRGCDGAQRAPLLRRSLRIDLLDDVRKYQTWCVRPPAPSQLRACPLRKRVPMNETPMHN